MKIFSAENPYIQGYIKYSLPILVIGIMSRTFPIISPAYFIVPVFLLINILLIFILIPSINKNLTYFFIIFAFPLYCLITSIWSLYAIISLQRSFYLLLLYAGILSSVLIYKKFYPDKGIGFLIPANIIILIISTISLIFGIPADSWSGGNGLGFMGFAGHQNTLAATILFTLPGLIALGLGQWSKDIASQVFRLSSFIVLLTSNLLLLLLTYSRASILALVIGTITYILVTKSKKILSFLFSITALLFVLYFTIPSIQNSINSVLSKDGGNILARRTVLWAPSVEAAKLGGMFGLGYGVSAPDIKTPILTGSHYEDGRYIREKGNSFLAIVEETGLIGLILFLLPMIWIIRKFIIYNSQFTIKENFRSNSTLYTCLPVGKVVHCTLLAMFVHAQFEAWWVGVGSITLPLYLIILFIALFPERIKN